MKSVRKILPILLMPFFIISIAGLISDNILVAYAQEYTPSSIGCRVSPDDIIQGQTVSISGIVDPPTSDATVQVSIYYRAQGETEWKTLDMVSPVAAITFGYTYHLDVDWPPGVYEIKAYWPGECPVSDAFGTPVEPPQTAEPSESEVSVLTVARAAVPTQTILTIWGGAAVAIVVVSGVFITLRRKYAAPT